MKTLLKIHSLNVFTKNSMKQHDVWYIYYTDLDQSLISNFSNHNSFYLVEYEDGNYQELFLKSIIQKSGFIIEDPNVIK